MGKDRQADNAPLVWVLAGSHAGDNAQAVALADALGHGYILKHLKFNGLYRVPNLFSHASCRSLQPAARQELCPPWPDLVIAVGRRTVPAATWLKKRSGGRTRLVHLGRPRAPLHWFDLVVTTPQYGLPNRPNVLHNPVPLTADPAVIPAETLQLWRSRLSHLPRPWIAVLAGGSRAPYVFDAVAARDLGIRASAISASRGGSLLVTTSPRTGDEAGKALAQSLVGPEYTYLWHAEGDNPYKAFLMLADRFIVTGESVSMVTEACRTGRPTQVFTVPRRGARAAGVQRDHPVQAWLTARGVLAGERNVERFIADLTAAGLVGRLDDIDFEPSVAFSDPMPGTLARVRALFAQA